MDTQHLLHQSPAMTYQTRVWYHWWHLASKTSPILNSHWPICNGDKLLHMIWACWQDQRNPVSSSCTRLSCILNNSLIHAIRVSIEKHATRCCTDDGKLIGKDIAHKTCYPIVVPKGDPAHSLTNVECMNFVRTLTDKDMHCEDNSPSHNAEQISVVTAFMDLSLVYGNSDTQNQPIRAFQGGR